MSGSKLRQRLAAILAADVAGYSRLMAADERATVAALDAARAIFRDRIESSQGRVIDMAGDSVLAVFETATGAVSAALAIQAGLKALIADAAEERQMRFRIGIHMGDVIEKDDGTVYGDGVNIAARLEGLAEPGGITVSESIRTAVKGKVGATFEDQGEQTVKNIPDPVWAYRVGPESGAVHKTSLAAGEIGLSLPNKPSIAVLPFTNMSGDPEQEYFADGITEDIITELSRYHSLFVVARNSTFTYKGKAVDVRAVSKALGVRYVVEGSIRKAGNRVRVTAQLIDAISGNHLWAEKYDRVLEDIFAVQEAVTQSIVTAIAPEIETAEKTKARRRRPTNLSAYEIAVSAWADSWAAQTSTDPSLREQAIRRARQALSIDPGSTLALQTLAWTKWQHLFARKSQDIEADWKEGMQAAQRAIDLDRTDSVGYFCKGTLALEAPSVPESYDRHAEALTALRRAHELNPNDASALRFMGYCEAISGDPVAGIEHIKESLRRNPLDPRIGYGLAVLSLAYFLAKDYQSGIQTGVSAAREAPNMFNLHVFLALNYVGIGKMEEARAALAMAQRLAPEYVQSRLNGYSVFRNAEDRQRHTVFLRIAAGLEDPSAADALR